MLASGRTIEWLACEATLREVAVTAMLLQDANKQRMKDVTQAIQMGVIGANSKEGARVVEKHLEKED
ncbi:MAG: hypothetical protein COA96_16740 [SAR86 cluster bacterium]|uniref:Uncharacterized protein n=1 Tax=SAR86 cluster bacterium TaxID=2030880 RepID=A0A2A5AG08_9GAMM|nr:MAG: hypothetical protein COA96_16740 [SAR86 cluster bacterium]